MDADIEVLRRRLVTSTEVPALFDVGFKTRLRLWLEKAGWIEREEPRRVPGYPGGPVDPLARGTALESGVAALFSWATGLRMHKIEGFWPHPSIEGCGCSPEYEAVVPGVGPILVELKTASRFAYNRWQSQDEEDWLWRRGGDEAKIRACYEIQSRVELSCSPGSELEPGEQHHGILVAVLVGLDELRIFPEPVEGQLRWWSWSEEFEADLAVRIDDFWASIERRNPPEGDLERDTVAEFSALKRHSETVVSLVHDGEFNAAMTEYLEAAKEERSAAQRKDRARKRMARAMSGAHVGVGRDGKAKVTRNGLRVSEHTWKKRRGR